MTKFDRFYMSCAVEAAKMSHARRAKVGAVIAIGNNIIDYGYNGMPEGMDNNCEDVVYSLDALPDVVEYPFVASNGKRYRLVTKPEVRHAEENAILKVAKTGGLGLTAATIYCTLSPCVRCARMIHGAGITRVFYLEEHSPQGIDFLKNCNVFVSKMEL